MNTLLLRTDSRSNFSVVVRRLDGNVGQHSFRMFYRDTTAIRRFATIIRHGGCRRRPRAFVFAIVWSIECQPSLTTSTAATLLTQSIHVRGRQVSFVIGIQ